MSRPLVYDNGKGGRRSPAQLARQEEAFILSVVENKSTRAIALELGVSQPTVISDIRSEANLRAAENEQRREFDLMAAVAQYRAVIRNEWDKSRLLQGMMLEHDKGALRIVDTCMQNIIAAQARIDKLLGLEAPTRIDIGLQSLIDAIEPTYVTPALEADVIERGADS